MSLDEDVFEGFSDDDIINLGIELLKYGKVNVDDAIDYVKAKDNLEKDYGKFDDDSTKEN